MIPEDQNNYPDWIAQQAAEWRRLERFERAMDLAAASPQPCEIPCHRCVEEFGLAVGHMIVCPKCGNKRCPHASDHRLPCTGSNEPGQAGSIYGGLER